ncbi:uncharacterized protein LOC110652384 isoform X1 [Hevea brasiliensis]|uniref:uncharacterized protein LOC110652384 isoform X1 n=1 Tax=Hevea brasiliensis TaxID=3981 RepID=UPI0025D04BA1|nr:uncharacterized protein LOC110652384 isoform X1 [Hevea brasiliensis]
MHMYASLLTIYIHSRATPRQAFGDIHLKLLMGSLMMKKLLFLILIVAGSISSCTLGVEVERFAWGKGRKEKTACQLITKAHSKRSSYFACEDVKRNHMNMLVKYSKYENLLPGSKQAVDANLRYNRMPRLAKLHTSQKVFEPGPIIHAAPSFSPPGGHG